MAYRIVYRSEDFLVVNKSPGIPVHGDEHSQGLISLIKNREALTTLLPVHRLDKVTSGVLVFALNDRCNRSLSMQFEARAVEKFYIALSNKKPKKKQGKISGDMDRARRGAWKLLPSQNNPALTRFFSKSISPGLRLFILKPHTGKTHQLRVALKSLGSPMLGDALYGSVSLSEADRVYLHAYSLGFEWQGKFHRFTALPDEGTHFEDKLTQLALTEFAKPWELKWPT